MRLGELPNGGFKSLVDASGVKIIASPLDLVGKASQPPRGQAGVPERTYSDIVTEGALNVIKQNTRGFLTSSKALPISGATSQES